LWLTLKSYTSYCACQSPRWCSYASFSTWRTPPSGRRDRREPEAIALFDYLNSHPQRRPPPAISRNRPGGGFELFDDLLGKDIGSGEVVGLSRSQKMSMKGKTPGLFIRPSRTSAKKKGQKIDIFVLLTLVLCST